VGKSAVFKSTEKITFASYLVRLRANQHFDPDFLCIVINSGRGRRFVVEAMGRAIGQVNVSASKLATFRIPAPPLREQRLVVEALGKIVAALDNMQRASGKRLAELNALDSALLGDAFSGAV
jgi:type I restriction enzyme S subunit